jgi:hypothetical protein
METTKIAKRILPELDTLTPLVPAAVEVNAKRFAAWLPSVLRNVNAGGR